MQTSKNAHSVRGLVSFRASTYSHIIPNAVPATKSGRTFSRPSPLHPTNASGRGAKGSQREKREKRENRENRENGHREKLWP